MSMTTSSALADTLPTGAFIVSPVKEELTLKPGGEKTVTITLSNGTPYPLTVTASYEDITANPQSTPEDSPVKLMSGGTAKDSLREWMNFPRHSFDLLSGKQIEIPVTIKLGKDATPGGRYGSVVWSFKVVSKLGESAPANVALESRIASLFFVRIEGETKEDGQLSAFGVFNDASRVAQPSTSTPLRFQVSYENKGNVYLDPYGRITVSGMLSDPKVLIVDPWAVLPLATRMREVDLLSALSPGYYHAHIELNRGYNNIVDEREVTFWVMPTTLEWIIGLILLILLTLLIRRSLALSRHSIS
jgi:hypothetical protein